MIVWKLSTFCIYTNKGTKLIVVKKIIKHMMKNKLKTLVNNKIMSGQFLTGRKYTQRYLKVSIFATVIIAFDI